MGFVVDKPSVSVIGGNIVTASERGPLSIDCKVDSFPVSQEIIWVKTLKSEDVKLSDGVKLHFDILTRRDSGSYLCKARNEVGEGFSSTYLSVQCKLF